MAKLKLPGRISAPDPGFSRRLEFEAAAENSPPTPLAEPLPPTRRAENTVVLPETETPSGSSNDPQPKGAATASAKRKRAAVPRTGSTPATQRGLRASGEDMVTIRVLYRLPDDLVVRAAAWAEKARCPTGTVLRRAMIELRPELVAALEAGIDYRDIPAERAKQSAHRFDSSITLSRATHARLCQEIDPEGLAGLTPALSRWVRGKVIAHLETWLARAGY
ncbi:hypothetical protein RGQ15_18750 [Paracoccus sp. MBLB3053]|uniref:Uncharacterized protein n=1 Tax=Paracoccus aurantius TaxID=3073814 RepID=A0ABU2HZ95_9RHOB|nr:hypothetical protein [Paracoccus sp. MBLB3053]MDS9469609.1 hypothetical protein [Paracoccus sp. MBLB3053]